jgi:protein-disulfide isomerase
VKPQARHVGASKILLVGLSLAVIGAVPAARAADDAASKQVIDYYRRKANLPPGVNANLKVDGDSKIPGAKKATLELSRGGQTQNVDLIMSPDGRYVVFGEVEDVTSDPFAEIAKKIKTEGEPSEGPADAKVTIVEYSDFQCPYCARAHSTIDQVMKEYKGKVRLVYKNFPLGFHKFAEPAAIAAECVYEQDPAAFWKLYDYYFTNQQQLNPDNIKDKTLEALKGSKVDKAKFTECFDNKKTLAKVQADQAEGQQVGVTGTPAFFINGRKLSGAQPLPRFKAIIDDELARAGEKKG